MADSILYQSVRDANGNPVQQLSNISLQGLSTISGQTQHTHGKLFGQYVQVDGTKTLSTSLENYDFTFSVGGTGYLLVLYSDPTRFSPVAVASSSTFGVTPITELNNSGLSGSVNFISYTADDLYVEVVALLSVDDDLPMDFISGLQEYDPVNGFSIYHQQAAAYIFSYITGREKTSLWNPTFIDTRSVNGALGGIDLSRVLNWGDQSFTEASAQYAFFKIAERNAIENGSTWDVRAKAARGLVRAHLEDISLSLDLTGNRVSTKQRATRSWRISRS